MVSAAYMIHEPLASRGQPAADSSPRRSVPPALMSSMNSRLNYRQECCWLGTGGAGLVSSQRLGSVRRGKSVLCAQQLLSGGDCGNAGRSAEGDKSDRSDGIG